jgi:SAM-dependent methyltransferase
MKRCLSCDNLYESESDACPFCKVKPHEIDGIKAYAPELTQSGGGFQSNYFAELVALEAGNFWFQSRNKLIIWALKKYCASFQSFLEIGCGTGYVLSGVAAAFLGAKLQGSEIFTKGLNFAAERLTSGSLMQMDARNIPFVREFDVIGAFDVLEHIKEDELVLSQVHTALKSQGYLVITVPQHQWLWSAVDEYACHERRYSKVDLHKKIQAAGFNIIRSTSFVTTLLPAMLISRLLQQTSGCAKFDAASELKIPKWLNYVFYQMLRAELAIIKLGVNLPIGGSRLVIAKKEGY